ncbi:MAG: hypothetical protein COW00_04760 [Bdellovibrio sp. CG12_big_fil_rev_8_21_14_0_65_39_13]|nr:MAG: hypothetical protein COW78_12960 [Bdellovibrio sp. CG22_combo_CG10-13_8_21_14_all_39_27]PIQ61121.1 MAG: hypothetical protein COW00_04760 [Bdellovibrio sp. CG12_big_fil_rev_8_21_14_0_65_39_13]PIR36889.1 MAG: hypothetical protein COV37_01780 [Bdellovibrio sp. CG11_big_fil_rev_8_21_14_0_20_39_38]PJB52284.1 MAG: hypothetical protein CO099_13435 [Bdellovibrio sp. CG_4_9_14_3_um_filter_39_7]
MSAPKLYDIQGEYNGKEFEIKISRHQSESNEFFLCRILAYLLYKKDGARFYSEVCEGDEPAVVVEEASAIEYWIDVGIPTLKKMKHARSKAKNIVVVAYRDLDGLKKLREQISEWSHVRMLYIKPPLLKEASSLVKPKMRVTIEWDGEWLSIGGFGGKILEF